jgi:glycerophosphoryl diester phosphodiesterase
LESFYLDRPLSFAHRGASHDAPANTLAAFLLAAELGADGIELDVQLSLDGEVVVIHDTSVDATTDGQGLVREKTLSELQALDAGSWFDPIYAGQRIPTLQEVIDLVGHRLLLNIELKTAGVRDDGLAAAVVAIIDRNHLMERVIVSSFDPLALRRVKRLDSRVPVGLLYSPDQPYVLRKLWLRRFLTLDALHPDHTMVDTDFVCWAKPYGYRINTWTVDEAGDMWQLMRQGVDLIITNRPELLRKVLVAGRGRWRLPTQRLLAAPQGN